MELSSPQHRLHHHNHHNNHLFSHNPLPSPTSSSSSSNNTTTTTNGLPSPRQNNPPTVTRSDPSNPYPTTFVQADTSSFKQVVQMLTGSPEPSSLKPKPANPIPPIKTTNKSKPSTKLYERRNNSLKHLRISPLLPTPAGSSPRHTPTTKNYTNNPDILSPSMLDFPSLVLSPVTPLIHDPFNRSPVSSPNIVVVDKAAEERAIAEKSFFLHPISPVSTPEPRLLPLFPVSSPNNKVVSSSDHHLHHQTVINRSS